MFIDRSSCGINRSVCVSFSFRSASVLLILVIFLVSICNVLSCHLFNQFIILLVLIIYVILAVIIKMCNCFLFISIFGYCL